MTSNGRGPSWRLIALLALLVVAVALYFVWVAVDRQDKTAERDQALGATQTYAGALSEVCATIPLAADRLGDLCEEAATVAETPEAVITPSPGPTGPKGERGPSPTSAEIRDAVRTVFAAAPDIPEAAVQGAVVDYLRENPPARGADGRGPTPDELEVAVATFCDGDACRGEPGVDGTPGSDGADGSVGPPASDEQIAAAVAAFCDDDGVCPTTERIDQAVARYCAADSQPCRGPAGDDGEDSTVPGPEGPPGPTCPDGAAPIEWTVDRATELLNGLEPGTYLLCRSAEPPEPTPTP